MGNNNTTHRQVIEQIKRSKKILVLPSAPPDGDSIGSAIALYLSLSKLGKEVTVICTDPVPEVLQFLPKTRIIGSQIHTSKDFIITLDCSQAKVDNIQHAFEDNKVNIIITPKEGQFTETDVIFGKGKLSYDLIITVDCAELKQLRDFYENNLELFHQVPVVNIDHHVSNNHFGRINHVDIMSSSTTELILPILEDLGKEQNIDLIDEDIATLLLTGIITDTGSFQNANTTPRSFAKAAQLIAYGARQQEIIQHIYKTKQLSQLKLWGRVLSKIQTDEVHRIVWSVVSQQDFKDTESSEEQTGDIIDELMTNAPGAEVILLIKERQDNTISVSIRTTSPSIDSSQIAEDFGGGGHTQAAGFRISSMNLRDAEYKIIEYVKQFQQDRLGLNTEKTTDQTDQTEQSEEIINVEELMNRVKEAQKAADMMPKAEDQARYEKMDETKPEVPLSEDSENLDFPKKKKKRRRKKKSNGESTAEQQDFSPTTPPTENSTPAAEVEIAAVEEEPSDSEESSTDYGYRFED